MVMAFRVPPAKSRRSPRDQSQKMLFENSGYYNRSTATRNVDIIRISIGRPQLEGEMYDPATFPSCENPLMIATHTARFNSGRGNELFIHTSITTSPAYVCAMRNRDMYRAAVFMVLIATTNLTIPAIHEPTMW